MKMADTGKANVGRRKKHRSALGDVIKFDPSENPPWREKETQVPSVRAMVAEIWEFQKQWKANKENHDDGLVKLVQREFLQQFVHHCNHEEEHGCDTLEGTKECMDSKRDYTVMSPKQKETVNLKDAYEYLLSEKVKEPDSQFHGLIEQSMLREANKMILKDITPLTRDQTKPGIFSDKERYTTYNGEEYSYKNPPDMHSAVNILLDKFNSLFEEFKNPSDAEDLCKLFKACSWLLFEMLDLHPFSDGNGRLCRLLCSYVLSTCTPFPTPIYNIWSTSSKHDYIDAIVETRKSAKRHPRSLVTMIIECNWSGWKKFLESFNNP